MLIPPLASLTAATLELKSEKTNAHSRLISSVAYNDDGTKIVSACRGGTIKVWEGTPPLMPFSSSSLLTLALPPLAAATLELKSEKHAHSGGINSVAISPNGALIVSGSDDRSIKVWDLVDWSRKDHLMFNVTTRRFILLLLWLNKYGMQFPDDVLDLLIKACLQSM